MTKDEALNIAIDYMNERLEEHDAKFQRHPVAEAERNNILADIEAVKEALAQQDSKDKEQAKTDSFVRQLDEALAQPWEKFCDSNCVWTDHHPDCKLAERLPLPAFTTGHCKEKAKEGGCQLHNIQCGFPACDRKES